MKPLYPFSGTQTVVEIFRRNVTRHYFDMQGRAGRREFWHFMLACVVIYLVAFILEAMIRRRVLTPIIGLFLLFPIAGLGARRLQDSNRNGVLTFAYTIPAAMLELVSLVGAYRPAGMSGPLEVAFRAMGLIWLIAAILFAYFWAQPGTAGLNRYGPDPYPRDQRV